MVDGGSVGSGSVTERQAFGIVVRGLGLVSVLYGFTQWLVIVARLIDPKNVPTRFPITEDVLFGVFWIVLGTLLIRGGWLVRFAYGPDSN